MQVSLCVLHLVIHELCHFDTKATASVINKATSTGAALTKPGQRNPLCGYAMGMMGRKNHIVKLLTGRLRTQLASVAKPKRQGFCLIMIISAALAACFAILRDLSNLLSPDHDLSNVTARSPIHPLKLSETGIAQTSKALSLPHAGQPLLDPPNA